MKRREFEDRIKLFKVGNYVRLNCRGNYGNYSVEGKIIKIEDDRVSLDKDFSHHYSRIKSINFHRADPALEEFIVQCFHCKGKKGRTTKPKGKIWVPCPNCGASLDIMNKIARTLRCKDDVWGQDVFPYGAKWCPHARKLNPWKDAQAKSYDDLRCAGWLYICKKTGKVVVHNKKCDVPEVIAHAEI